MTCGFSGCARLGFPTSDEYAIADGGRTDFQNNCFIDWHANTGAAHGFRYSGLFLFRGSVIRSATRGLARGPRVDAMGQSLGA